MRDPIKSFGKVEENGVNLLPVTESPGKVIHRQQELRLAGTTLAESKLAIGKKMMILKVIDDLAMNDVFEYFTDNGCE